MDLRPRRRALVLGTTLAVGFGGIATAMAGMAGIDRDLERAAKQDKPSVTELLRSGEAQPAGARAPARRDCPSRRAPALKS
jgi:hypothetical protein